VHLESTEDAESYYRIKEVKVKVDRLKFKIRDSKHQILYSTLRPLATSLIKKQISKAIEDAIRSGLVQLDGQLVEVKRRLQAAEGDEDTSKTQVIKDVFSHKKTEAEEKTEAAKPKGTFKVCVFP
jgi:hypothetical protein